MFENSIITKRLLKRKNMMDELEKAKKDGESWKINQLESKISEFNRKNYPNVFWNSSKGTYHKQKGAK